jgi:hypothetical protein
MERMSEVEGTCRLTRVVGRDKTTVSDATFAAGHGMRKVRIVQRPRSEKFAERPEAVYCLGPDTAFTLVRTSEAEPYSVKGIGTDAKDRTGYLHKFGRYRDAAYSVLGVPLVQIMKQPNFHITDVERVKLGGGEVMRVNFRMGKAPGDSEVRLVLDPSLGWAIRSGELQPVALRGRAKISFEAEYDSGAGRPMLPKVVRFEDLNGDKFTCEFLEVRNNTRPPQEFKMPYYGLPDMTVAGPTGTGRTLLYWAAGALGGASLLIWQAMRYARGRRLGVS